MKLSGYGYKSNEPTIHGYCMEMGELKILLCQKMIEKSLEENKLRIVHCGNGEVDEYQNMKDFMLHDFNNRFDILVFNIHVQHFNDTNEDIIVAVIADDESED